MPSTQALIGYPEPTSTSAGIISQLVAFGLRDVKLMVVQCLHLGKTKCLESCKHHTPSSRFSTCTLPTRRLRLRPLTNRPRGYRRRKYPSALQRNQCLYRKGHRGRRRRLCPLVSRLLPKRASIFTALPSSCRGLEPPSAARSVHKAGQPSCLRSCV